jgi:hypothetical protein
MDEEDSIDVCSSFSLSITLKYQDYVDELRHHHRPTIFMIRHGEKPRKDRHGDDPGGLSRKGLKRADAITEIFGEQSSYDIGLIMAQRFRSNGARIRPYDTVKPLARSLGLEVDDSVDRDDIHEAAHMATSFKGPGDVLICWEHHRLGQIARRMGVKDFSRKTGMKGERIAYPIDRFDLIWVIPYPYNRITDILSERVPGLDLSYANMLEENSQSVDTLQ